MDIDQLPYNCGIFVIGQFGWCEDEPDETDPDELLEHLNELIGGFAPYAHENGVLSCSNNERMILASTVNSQEEEVVPVLTSVGFKKVASMTREQHNPDYIDPANSWYGGEDDIDDDIDNESEYCDVDHTVWAVLLSDIVAALKKQRDATIIEEDND